MTDYKVVEVVERATGKVLSRSRRLHSSVVGEARAHIAARTSDAAFVRVVDAEEAA